MAVIAAVLFALGVLISTGVASTVDGQAVMDQEKINRQLELVLKALDYGNITAAEGYLEETVQALPAGLSKTHLDVAINALQTSNDATNAKMHIQEVQDSLQNSTG
jgi:hypothetical protein